MKYESIESFFKWKSDLQQSQWAFKKHIYEFMNEDWRFKIYLKKWKSLTRETHNSIHEPK